MQIYSYCYEISIRLRVCVKGKRCRVQQTGRDHQRHAII